jgi:hypothetical protein
MKLKKSLFLFLTLMLFAFTTSDVGSKVKEYLGDRYEWNVNNNPGYIKYLNAKADFGYEIIKKKGISENQIQGFYGVTKKNANGKHVLISAADFENDLESMDFNFLMYNFKLKEGKTCFKLSTDKKVITITSEKVLYQLIKN